MKRALTTTIQILVSLILIGWIFHDGHKRAQMVAALHQANLWWFLPGVAVFGVVLILQTARWQLLLRAIDIRFPWLRSGQLVMIGMFFNFVLPGATGGDVVKIFYGMREIEREKAAVFLSVVLDRVVGLVALAFVSTVVVAWNFHTLMSTPVAQELLVMIALILGGSLTVVITAVVVAALRLEDRLPARLPARQGIVDLAIATRRYAKASGTLAAVFAISVFVHFLIFGTFYFSARAFAAGLTYADICSVMPIVNTLTALPISLQGLGLRESLFERLLAALYRTPAPIADLVSMGGYLVTVVWNLAGGIVYMFYRPSDGHAASLREMSTATGEIAKHPTP